MTEQLRRTLDSAAPTDVSVPDTADLWRRGRRRRRAGQATATLACLALFVAVGWTVQQVAGRPSLEVVGTPDDGDVADVQVQADAVWRTPAADAMDAVEKFTAEAFGWSANLTVEGIVPDSRDPMFVTVSTPAGDVEVTMLMAAGPGDLWQIFQVQTDGGGGRARYDRIELPLPDGAATMDVFAWADGQTIHLRGPATSTILLSQLGVDHLDLLGGSLVIYRDGTGNLVGAHGNQFGMGGVEPSDMKKCPEKDCPSDST